MSNFALRTISGIIYVLIILAAIVAGSPWFSLLIAVMAALGVVEMQSVVKIPRKGTVAWVALLCDVLAAISLAVIPLTGLFCMVLLQILLVGYFLLRAVLALYDLREHPFRNAAWSILSVLYLALPMMALNSVYCESANTSWLSGEFNTACLVLIGFVMIWLNDTGAYCVGSMLGRHKMCPRLSPKKSWEGFAGGLSFCLIAGAVCWKWFNCVPQWGLLHWLGLGLIACLFSTWGDLFESLMKRNAGVKDSGNLIPGHGGILDRIDSLLFVGPAIYLYFTCLN